MNFLNIIEQTILHLSHFIWSWPIIIFIICSSLYFTFIFKGVQIVKFFTGWKYTFIQEKTDNNSESISPLQAFINALSSSLGNGGLAGMATVLVDGGPGTAFWIFILGFFSMILRFTEVYATVSLKGDGKYTGPLSYISKLPFGIFFSYAYVSIMLIYIFVAGNAMQCEAMGKSLIKITHWNPIFVALIFFSIVLYIVFGGSKRIMKVSEKIIPIKVVLFFILIFYVIFYHLDKINYAIKLILANALNLESFGKGLIAYSIKESICYGFSRTLNATEAGTGTASIFFGSSDSTATLRNSVMSMITAFISTNLVCFSLVLSLVLCGIDQNGLTGSELVIASFQTALGSYAGPLVTFLSFSFGLGVLVAYSFLGQKMWEFLFGKKYIMIYIFLFALVAFFGSLTSVKLIWSSIDLLAALLIIINVLALLNISPKLKQIFNKEYV